MRDLICFSLHMVRQHRGSPNISHLHIHQPYYAVASDFAWIASAVAKAMADKSSGFAIHLPPLTPLPSSALLFYLPIGSYPSAPQFSAYIINVPSTVSTNQ